VPHGGPEVGVAEQLPVIAEATPGGAAAEAVREQALEGGGEHRPQQEQEVEDEERRAEPPAGSLALVARARGAPAHLQSGARDGLRLGCHD
jgi:hypothetical protein